MKKRVFAALLFTVIAAFSARPDNPPLPAVDESEPAPPPGRGLDRALTAAEKERILRGGVLTLFGSRLPNLEEEERQHLAEDVKASTASYLRWLGYFWTGWDGSDGPDYQGRWTEYFDAFRDIATRVHALSSGTYVEFVIPELVTEEVSQIDLSTPKNREIATLLLNKTGVVLPARFDFAKIRQDKPQYGAKQYPDYVWSCHYRPDECDPEVVTNKNGIPSLSKPQGEAWVLYLAARALLQSDADAIFIVPSRDRAATNPWGDFADVVAKIRKLKPNVIIGSQELNLFPPPPSGIVPRNQVDFIKTQVDVDIYRTDAQGRRTVAPSHLDTARVACYPLNDDGNALYLPNTGDENLCVVANRIGRRPMLESQPDYLAKNSIEDNTYGLPILLEYDPGLNDCGPIYLPPPNPELTSDCNPRIRHGLTVSTIFPMSTTAVRHRYIQYSYRVARNLSRSRGFPVYAFGWLEYGEGLEIRRAWHFAKTDPKWEAQKAVLRMMPEGAGDHGVIESDGLPPRAYSARKANGDRGVLKAAIRAVVP